MKNKNIYIAIILGLLSFTLIRCDDDIDPLVNELNLNRSLTPTGLTARIRNFTTIELTWNVRDDVDHYVVEYSEDSLEFNTIIRTVTVMPDDLPLQENFESETRYSARVKAVKEGSADSKWATVTIMTGLENIFLPIQNGDIDALTATVRWEANSDVTHLLINPGNTQRAITADEKTAGVAIVDGLTGDTDYTIRVYNNAQQRGAVSFKTLIDVGDATRVYPEDDLDAVITAATDGDVLVLYPGSYTVFKGLITINKSITIRGLYPYDKPIIYVKFVLTNAVQSVELIDLEMNGEGLLNDIFLYESTTPGAQFGSLSLSGCNIHDYTHRLVYAPTDLRVASFSVNNCIVTNVDTSNGGDFIDFRNSGGPYVASVSLTNSTFNNCAPGRDFVRIDNTGYGNTGLTTNVLIDHCTIYGVSNTSDRILYVRFLANTLTVQNSLFAATDGYYTNQSNSSQPTCSNNNYFNAPGFYTPAYVTGAKIDISGNHTTLDPGFVNAANGNFKVTNQTIIDNNIGDPRWLQ